MAESEIPLAVEEKINEIERRLGGEEDINIFNWLVPKAPAGLILEFGVYKGDTLREIARAAGERIVYGFDSFEGLPEHWATQEAAGAFKTMPPRDIPANSMLVIGLFQDTLPKFMGKMKEPVAFIHVDCDLYSSTKCIFDVIGTNVSNGAIILFDEIIGYYGYKMHEIRAFAEWLIETGYDFSPVGKRHPRSAAVRIKK